MIDPVPKIRDYSVVVMILTDYDTRQNKSPNVIISLIFLLSIDLN